MITIHVSSRLYEAAGHQAITEWLNMKYGCTDYWIVYPTAQPLPPGAKRSAGKPGRTKAPVAKPKSA